MMRNRYFHTWALLVPLLVSFGGSPAGAAAEVPDQDTDRRIQGDFRVRPDEHIEANFIVEEGDLTVDGEIDGWVVVRGGEAIVRGTVRGDVVVVYGNVTVLDRGRIRGDAVSIGGDVNLRGDGTISGNSITTTLRGWERQGSEVTWARILRRSGVLDEPDYRRPEPPSRPRAPNRWVGRRWNRYHEYLFNGDFPLGGLVYNRVDGWTIQGSVFNSDHDWGTAATNFFVGGGYAFSSQRWYYRLGLNRYWFPDTPLEVGGSIFRQLQSEDTWYLTPNENDAMAALARYDWFDYYLTEGYQFHVRLQPRSWLDIGARFSQETESAVVRSSEWALFGGDRRFRDNTFYDAISDAFVPSQDGEVRRLVYHVRLGNRNDGDWLRHGRGVSLGAWLEQAGETDVASGGDFVYQRWVGELVLSQRLSPVDRLVVRVRAGAASDPVDDIPVQHRFYLGGIGSLRGYGFKEFSGNRLFLGTAEYRLGSDGWSPVFNDWALAIFYDYGLAWTTPAGNGIWTDLIPEEPKKSIGLAVSPFGINELRVEVAKPLEDGRPKYVYYIRWALDF
jgi:hypothetical protein